MQSDDDYHEPLNKVLIPVKWRGRHFHILGDGGCTEKEVRLLMHTHLFPKEVPYEQGIDMIEVSLELGTLRLVEGEEYRYLCTGLVDLDNPDAPT